MLSQLYSLTNDNELIGFSSSDSVSLGIYHNLLILSAALATY